MENQGIASVNIKRTPHDLIVGIREYIREQYNTAPNQHIMFFIPQSKIVNQAMLYIEYKTRRDIEHNYIVNIGVDAYMQEHKDEMILWKRQQPIIDNKLSAERKQYQEVINKYNCFVNEYNHSIKAENAPDEWQLSTITHEHIEYTDVIDAKKKTL